MTIAISTYAILTAEALIEFQMKIGFAEIVLMRWRKSKEGDNLEKIGNEKVISVFLDGKLITIIKLKYEN